MFERQHRDGRDAHICAAAADERSALCSRLLAAFDGVDVSALDASAAVDAAVAADPAINRFTAIRMQAIATTVQQTRGTTRVEPERAAAAELGAALRLGSSSIDREISYALELTGRLRRSWSAMHAGDLAYSKARLVVDETFDLSDDDARKVEAAVPDEAPQRTWSQHAAAVRRAVVRVDPAAPERRRKASDRAAQLVRRSSNDGLADLIVRLPAAQVEMAYNAADAWARARKAAGDERTLDVLRAAAIARWASSYLTHGDPTTCDTVCDAVPSPRHPADVGDDVGDAGADDGDAGGDNDEADGGNDEEAASPQIQTAEDTDDGRDLSDPAELQPVPSPRAPSRHGRALRVGLIWGLSSLLGLDDAPGELLDSGEVISAADMRAVIDGGIRVRRLLVDPGTGELVDATPDPTADQPAAPAHGEPMWLGVVVDTATWEAWRDGRLTGLLATGITLAPKPIRDLLAARRTEHLLDGDPCAESPSPRLAEFVALRDRHRTNPCAAPTAAGAGDADHVRPRAAGGPTTRANLHSPTRRWHVLRTAGGWTLRRNPGGGTVWRSPQGRIYRTGPYDYRRGP